MTTYAWHVHHDRLVEPLAKPGWGILAAIEVRQAYIREHKPEREQALRLRLLQPVRGKLPAAYTRAGAAWVRAEAALNRAGDAYTRAGAAWVRAKAAYIRAGDAYDRAGDAYDRATARALPAIMALHAIECPDCPWDGTTIFPKAGA